MFNLEPLVDIIGILDGKVIYLFILIVLIYFLCVYIHYCETKVCGQVF